MDLDVSRFIDDLGGTAEVAALLTIKAPSVSGWKEKGRIPDDKLIRLAPVAEARGIKTRQQLFPTDYGQIWPELLRSGLAGLVDRRAADTVHPFPDLDRRTPLITAGEG